MHSTFFGRGSGQNAFGQRTSRRGSGCDKNHTIHNFFWQMINWTRRMNVHLSRQACCKHDDGQWRLSLLLYVVQNYRTQKPIWNFIFFIAVFIIVIVCWVFTVPARANSHLYNWTLVCCCQILTHTFFVFLFPFPGNALMDFNCAKHIFTCSCSVRFHHTRVTAVSLFASDVWAKTRSEKKTHTYLTRQRRSHHQQVHCSRMRRDQ